MSELVKYYLEAYSFQKLNPFDFFLFLKLSLSLSRYRSDRFGYRVSDIEVADLEKVYRIIVIEVGVRLRMPTTGLARLSVL